jgi:hypothetical protein
LSIESESAVICPNIIIITNPDLEEGTEDDSVRKMLKFRYSTRKIQEFCFDNWSDDPTFVQVEGDGKPKEGSEDTGIYVIVHGSRTTGLLQPLIRQSLLDKFAAELFGLTEKKFKLRKMCFITCQGVAMEGKIAKQVPQQPAPEDENTAPPPLFVQNVCQAIAASPGHESLEGLMIAGYESAVFVNETIPDLRQGVKTTQAGKKEALMKPDLTKTSGLKSKLQSYAQRKIIFVLQNGAWRLGSLLEYSDSAELKSKLQSTKALG